MATLRALLMIVAVLLFCLGFFVGGVIGVPQPWEYPRESLRHQAFEYFFVKHRWLTVAVYGVYFSLVLFAFRTEVRSVFLRPSFSRIARRVLLLAAALAAVAYYELH
jgi:hypothetical protein